ncbi:uncharacterized protein PV07_03464 [Cladophialophora immunda]|uniref:Uncharacterized protein n=1 Tax=Cladophialophora immunda TaxID=569365 RepID=A0A0D2CPD2_9EURO|nr:uncharacterized protein PV07_03464 [Cladophialophora immunda]KIW31875.1 hypothetical protein PV07_03464 [Cladophialophora immunda]
MLRQQHFVLTFQLTLHAINIAHDDDFFGCRGRNAIPKDDSAIAVGLTLEPNFAFSPSSSKPTAILVYRFFLPEQNDLDRDCRPDPETDKNSFSPPAEVHRVGAVYQRSRKRQEN